MKLVQEKKKKKKKKENLWCKQHGERSGQQLEKILTLITNLETLATPDRYVYVGLERSSRFIFPLPICRGKIGPASDAQDVGGTRWRTRERRTGAF